MKARTIALVLLAAATAACAPTEKPVGIGRGTDEFKKSPCACETIPQRTPPGFWNYLEAMTG